MLNNTTLRGEVKNLKASFKTTVYKGFRAGGQIKNECSWKPLVYNGFRISRRTTFIIEGRKK